MFSSAYYDYRIVKNQQRELLEDLEMKRQIREVLQSKANQRVHFLRQFSEWLRDSEPSRNPRKSNLAKVLNY